MYYTNLFGMKEIILVLIFAGWFGFTVFPSINKLRHWSVNVLIFVFTYRSVNIVLIWSGISPNIPPCDNSNMTLNIPPAVYYFN